MNCHLRLILCFLQSYLITNTAGLPSDYPAATFILDGSAVRYEDVRTDVFAPWTDDVHRFDQLTSGTSPQQINSFTKIQNPQLLIAEIYTKTYTVFDCRFVRKPTVPISNTQWAVTQLSFVHPLSGSDVKLIKRIYEIRERNTFRRDDVTNVQFFVISYAW